MRRILLFLLNRLGFFLPDKAFLKMKYWLSMGEKLDLDSPKTYTAKINWLKLYDRDSNYTLMVDKYRVKKLVAEKIGKQYIIPTLGFWTSPKDIDFDSLPDKFVLKCNHNSGIGMCICTDKSKLDLTKVKKGLRKGLRQNYYLQSREWPYRNVKRGILAEQYMCDEVTGELRDYKFFCFDGKVRGLFVATGRSRGDHETRFDFFDPDYNHLPFTNGHPNADTIPEKPIRFDEMKRVASKLSEGIPAVRVDLYEIDGRVYFGELTFSHWGGFMPFCPKEWDSIFGEWIVLPDKD